MTSILVREGLLGIDERPLAHRREGVEADGGKKSSVRSVV
jgi:hypothetical protein